MTACGLRENSYRTCPACSLTNSVFVAKFEDSKKSQAKLLLYSPPFETTIKLQQDQQASHLLINKEMHREHKSPFI